MGEQSKPPGHGSSKTPTQANLRPAQHHGRLSQKGPQGPCCPTHFHLTDGKTDPVKAQRGSVKITQLDGRAGHNLCLLSQPTAHPKPTLAAAHPGNGCEPRSENNSNPGLKLLRADHPRPAEASLGHWKDQAAIERSMPGRGAAGGQGREGAQLTLPARGWGRRWGLECHSLLASA